MKQDQRVVWRDARLLGCGFDATPSVTPPSDTLSPATLNRLARRSMRPVHRRTKSPLDTFSTLLKVCFHSGKRLRQIHFLHHFSPFNTPSSVAHIDCHATRSGCV